MIFFYFCNNLPYFLWLSCSSFVVFKYIYMYIFFFPPLGFALFRFRLFFKMKNPHVLCLCDYYLSTEFQLLYFRSEVKWSESESLSVMSDSLLPHGLYNRWNCLGQILEWVAIPFSRGSSQPRDWTQISHIAGPFFTSGAIREAPKYWSG